mmetsp:Transcript_29000/g.93508  ORF Transcript_29000/g.93508 Transcript_29000/m.93508 type:complete len:203 (-) Transcript_29000:3035-3643(-)
MPQGHERTDQGPPPQGQASRHRGVRVCFSRAIDSKELGSAVGDGAGIPSYDDGRLVTCGRVLGTVGELVVAPRGSGGGVREAVASAGWLAIVEVCHGGRLADDVRRGLDTFLVFEGTGAGGAPRFPRVVGDDEVDHGREVAAGAPYGVVVVVVVVEVGDAILSRREVGVAAVAAVVVAVVAFRRRRRREEGGPAGPGRAAAA